MINKHFNARRRHDSKIFLRFWNVFDTLNEIFNDFNRVRNVRVKYNEFRMNSAIFFVEFYVEFILLINQFINCLKKTRIKNLKNKITNTLTRAIVNNEFFISLCKYKKHLQITDEKLKNSRRVFKINDRKTILKNNKFFNKNIAKIVESFLRMLFKLVKFYTKLQKRVMINVINEFNCWNCNDLHRLTNCFHDDKKNQWI